MIGKKVKTHSHSMVFRATVYNRRFKGSMDHWKTTSGLDCLVWMNTFSWGIYIVKTNKCIIISWNYANFKKIQCERLYSINRMYRFVILTLEFNEWTTIFYDLIATAIKLCTGKIYSGFGFFCYTQCWVFKYW